MSTLGWLYLVMGTVLALLMVKRRIEYLCDRREFRELGIVKPVPFDAFRQAWEANAEIFLGDERLPRGYYDVTGDLKQDCPEYWFEIYHRGVRLVGLYHGHPNLLAPWIQEGQDPAHRFHPAVLYTAATMPAHLDDGFSDFKPANFSKLVQQAAAQMDTPDFLDSPAFWGLLILALAIVLFVVRRMEQQDLTRAALKPVPFEVFRQAWEANAELFLRAAITEDRDEARATVIEIGRHLRQRHFPYWQAILFRTSALMRLWRSHPGPLARWTREEGGAGGLFHPAVLLAAATMPLSQPRFERSAFFDLVQQAAAQMETGETAP